MALTTGTKLGPYEIVSPLGAGGMGEVYRARDTRLERFVAIKVLAAHLSEDADAKRRLDAEARAISSLQHPNICTLYDVGHQDDVAYLVMEYLEGETLADRLMHGPLPLPDLLQCAAEICAGLDKAHASGVIHRDLKPANIMLTPTGAKIMDFGLAKIALAASLEGRTVSFPMTSSAPMSTPGMISGTVQYMAPEQVDGNPADARSDIFALGAVLYEMATGQRAFAGKTAASVMAALLERDPPPVSSLRSTFPRALDRIVQTCLAKKPEERWRSPYDIKLQLCRLEEDLETGALATEPARQGNAREKLAWGLATALFVAAVLLAALSFRGGTPVARPVRASLLPPANWSFLLNGASLSPDGTRLAFIGVGPNGETTLWVRSLADAAAQPLGATDGRNRPFWSPDSTRLGFFADEKLKTVDAAGGSPRTLCAAPFGRGGTWNRDGTIVFAPQLFGPLYRVAENGGVPEPVTKVRGGSQTHTWPFFLPDGKHFLFAVDWSAPEDTMSDGIYVGSLEGGAPKLVTADFTGNVAFASGKLLYVRDLILMAQPFDASRLELAGPAVPLSDHPIATNVDFSLSAFSVSQTGMLVFQPVADLASQLVWFRSSGQEVGPLPSVSPKDPYLSPDGRFVAFVSDEGRNGKYYLRVYDVARDVTTRLTEGGSEDTPAWTHDGKKLAYKTREGKIDSIYQIAADGSSPRELLVQGPRMNMLDWSPDGHLVYADFSHGLPHLSSYSSSDHKSTAMYPGAEPRISPDGHWLLYTFSALGGLGFRGEVFVQPFPGPGARLQVSRAGGMQGTWSKDGKQIFFIAPDKKMMAASFDAQHQTAGAPRVLFQTRIIAASFVFRQYDVAPDGRFLINSLLPGAAPPITLLSDWTAQARR